MKKTIKLNVLVVAFIFILYLISTGICFSNAKTNIKDEYDSEKYIFGYNIYEDVAADLENEEYPTYESIDDILAAYNSSFIFPYRLVAFDSDGREVGRTGTLLDFTSHRIGNNQLEYFEKYNCYIDEYLTDEIREQLAECMMNGSYLKEVGYAFENGDPEKVIPVYINYEDGYGNLTEKIVLNNAEVIGTVNVPNDSIGISMDFMAEEGYVKKCFDYIDNNIKSDEFKEYLSTEDFGDKEFDNGLYYNKINGLLINDEQYTIMLVSYMEPVSFTLHNYQFVSSMRNLTLLYLAITAIVLALVNFYIKRNRLNNAKYVFSNAAAHELKTPLAVIENKCEFILEGVDESKTAEYVNETYKEALRMNTLLNNLLRYNKLSTISRVEKADSNLRQLVENELEKYSSAAKVKNITFNIELTDADINCNDELISLAVGNLLSNAIKFSPSDSTVSVILTKFKKKKYKLSVINRFDGVIDKKVWDMLYVSDEARSGKSTGMGLPISKEIFELHRYKYGFKNENGTVEFYFIAK